MKGGEGSEREEVKGDEGQSCRAEKVVTTMR